MGELDFQLFEVSAFERLKSPVAEDTDDADVVDFNVSLKTATTIQTLVVRASLSESGGIHQILRLPTQRTINETFQLCLRDIFAQQNEHTKAAHYLSQLSPEKFPQIIQMAKAACHRPLGTISRRGIPPSFPARPEKSALATIEVAPSSVPARYMFRYASAIQVLTFIRHQLLHSAP